MKLASNGEIVMVDDNPGDSFLAEQCLEESTLENPWRSFSNGPDFLAHLGRVRTDDSLMPALVLLDINMPGMSGLEVLQATRSDAHFRSLPIFCMLTSSSDPRDKLAAEKSGASGFVTKPSDPAEYVAFFDSLNPAT